MDVRKITYKDMPIGLDGLIDWLEGQDPETEYDYGQSRECLMTVYGHAVGQLGISFSPCQPDDQRRPKDWVMSLDLWDVARTRPFTYGAALSRAKALRGA